MPFPLAPHHVQLISACYPPSSALLTSGPEYKPNSQELSRLVYYASNRPGKLAKLSNELDKRITTDARRAKTGNSRARASLLITLNILKALVTECRRDLSLFSTSLMSALNSSLGALPGDLEVSAKVATVFTAWATYTNGQLLGVDQNLTRDYISVLRHFASMCGVEAKNNDLEDRNRTRLIGLGALTGAVASEALYNSSSQFRSQVSVIVSAFTSNILQSDMHGLEHESEATTKYFLPLSPYTTDFRSRPLLERRAASIHAHIDGDTGPTTKDVASVSVRALACLFNQSNGSQVGHVLRALFDSLGLQNGWIKVGHCCWLAQKAVEWTRYQYRFAIPVRLVDRLVEAQDDPSPSDMHKALAMMIKTVLTAPTPLVNLSTSDICSSLTALVLRRVVINPHDNLLPALVDCMGALGSHIYYADQIHDLACEIIGRLVNIESNGLVRNGRMLGPKDEERVMALRCLIAALGILIKTSSSSARTVHDGMNNEPANKFGAVPAAVPDVGRPGSPISSDAHSVRETFPQRSRISADVWQETLTLLCDENVFVRLEYAKALILFIRTELRPQNDFPRFSKEENPKTHTNGDSSGNAMDASPLRRIRSRPTSVGDGSTDRFIHALHASLYVLATSTKLNLQSSSPPSPAHSIEIDREHDQMSEAVHVNITPSTPMQSQNFASLQDRADERSPDMSLASQASRRKSLSIIQSRKLHRIRWLLDAAKHNSSPSDSDVTTSSSSLSDYAHILAILDALHEQVPPKALLLGFPMLLMLRSWCASECPSPKRRFAIRELVIRHGRAISSIWACERLKHSLDNASLDSTFHYPVSESTFLSQEEPLALDSLTSTMDLNWPCDTSEMIDMLSMSRAVQHATGLGEDSLRKRLEISWSPDTALRDSIEPSANSDASSRPEHSNPLLKISPALMHISNLSLQSLARSSRAVGVNDLRDALEGRAGSSSVALGQGRAPSIASLGATVSGASGESAGGYLNMLAVPKAKPRVLNGENPVEVKEVLDKLGIGARNKISTLRSQLSPRQSGNTRSVLVPPYNKT